MRFDAKGWVTEVRRREVTQECDPGLGLTLVLAVVTAPGRPDQGVAPSQAGGCILPRVKGVPAPCRQPQIFDRESARQRLGNMAAARPLLTAWLLLVLFMPSHGRDGRSGAPTLGCGGVVAGPSLPLMGALGHRVARLSPAGVQAPTGRRRPPLDLGWPRRGAAPHTHRLTPQYEHALPRRPILQLGRRGSRGAAWWH